MISCEGVYNPEKLPFFCNVVNENYFYDDDPALTRCVITCLRQLDIVGEIERWTGTLSCSQISPISPLLQAKEELDKVEA